MSKNVFYIADTHHGHAGVCKFTRSDGVTPLRPWDDPTEMDEDMIQRWNSVVGPYDKVYHMGDVAISKKGLEVVKRLNGKKHLIMGNHDIFRNRDYHEAGFDQLRACRVFVDQFILTHVPLHPGCVTDRFKTNVHGHLHSNRVMLPRGVNAKTGEILYSDKIDPRYFCVSAEHINFTPIHHDDLVKKIAEQS